MNKKTLDIPATLSDEEKLANYKDRLSLFFAMGRGNKAEYENEYEVEICDDDAHIAHELVAHWRNSFEVEYTTKSILNKDGICENKIRIKLTW